MVFERSHSFGFDKVLPGLTNCDENLTLRTGPHNHSETSQELDWAIKFWLVKDDAIRRLFKL